MNMQKLRAQIAALQDATMDENKNFLTTYDEGAEIVNYEEVDLNDYENRVL